MGKFTLDHVLMLPGLLKKFWTDANEAPPGHIDAILAELECDCDVDDLATPIAALADRRFARMSGSLSRGEAVAWVAAHPREHVTIDDWPSWERPESGEAVYRLSHWSDHAHCAYLMGHYLIGSSSPRDVVDTYWYGHRMNSAPAERRCLFGHGAVMDWLVRRTK